MEDDRSSSLNGEAVNLAEENSNGWQKVSYAKKQRSQKKNAPSDSSRALSNGSVLPSEKNSVFQGLEKHAEERRKKLGAQRAASAIYDDDDDEILTRSRNNRRKDEDEDGFSSDTEPLDDVPAVNKKEKRKKAKNPKITITEAAAKIDADDLASFLSTVSDSYEGQQDIQLMRFADYFGRAFSAVGSSQFPWVKLFRESPVAKISDVPVSYISEAVYKTSVDWINLRSPEALANFVVWALDCILADLAVQQLGSKGAKKGSQPASSKSQVAIFLVLALVLRRKPDVLISVLTNSKDISKYQSQDRLPIIIWMITQACHGDLAVGLYLWAHHILLILEGKSASNPRFRDLVLQLAERILAAPKAQGILVNNAVRKGERLVPPAALEQLLRLTFPSSSARVKSTERFEAIYPVLKGVSLAGSPGSKAMKQVSLQVQTIAVKAIGEGIPELSAESTQIFIWCLNQSPDCYRQWDKLYVDNIEVSVAILRKLTEDWKTVSSSSQQVLEETLKSFREKNQKELRGGGDTTRLALFKDADRYCRILSGRVSSGRGCFKTVAVVGIAVLGVGAVAMSPYVNSLDLSKVSVLFNPS
ncbi:hypothetical protein M569_03811, partial [Genlisea aurea]